MNLSKILVTSGIVVSAITLFPVAGRAEESPPTTSASALSGSNPNPESAPAFGRKGQWYLMAPNIWGSRENHDASSGYSMPSFRAFAAELAFGTFVRDHLSLGMDVGANYNSADIRQDASAQTQNYAAWGMSVHLVAGWQRAVNTWVSFWPRLALGGTHLQQDTTIFDATGPTTKDSLGTNIFDGAVELPVILHVTRHLFVDVTWSMHVESRWADGNSLRAYSATGIGLGGWI